MLPLLTPWTRPLSTRIGRVGLLFALLALAACQRDAEPVPGAPDEPVAAVEALDNCIAQVTRAVESVGGQLLITADHGNAEQMRDPSTGQAHTAHTNLPVPLIYVGEKTVKALSGGKLSDIAPTMLSLMGEEIPQEMTGKPLFIVE